jgi:hypothetical protein
MSSMSKHYKNLTRITDTLHEDLREFIFRLIFLELDVSDKICRENQNTHFMFYVFPPKIMHFVR